MTDEVKKKRGPNKPVDHKYGNSLPRFLLPLWGRFLCKSGWHVWSEYVYSYKDHWLCCDSCGETVKIR